MPLLPELAALNAYRLGHDRTWQELSEDMALRGVSVPSRTLHYLLMRMPAGRQPRDRTLFKIRQFLDAIAAAEPNAAGRSRLEAEDRLTPA